MLARRTLVTLLLSSAALAGCASCPPCESKAASAAGKPETCSSEGDAAAPVAALEPSAPGAAPTAPAAPAPPAGSVPPSEPAPAPQAGSLPEVKVENVGLHIGGGPNDDAAKAPFLRAIEKQFDALRGCYAKVEEPMKGGTFGVDLHIGRDGGRAQVKQPRTGMKGAGFRDCVVKAFGDVEFEKPKKGPTVISYSVKYGMK